MRLRVDKEIEENVKNSPFVDDRPRTYVVSCKVMHPYS
jgi:hypothetical protein